MSVDATHPEYDEKLPVWDKIDAICDRAGYSDYLIELNPDDDSVENEARNQSYAQRALFVSLAGYTVRGLTGLAFVKTPDLDVPDQLQYVEDDIDGTGISIYQQSQMVVSEATKKGRLGLWVDFPPADRPLSVADMQSGNYRSACHLFKAAHIYNWHTGRIGNRTILTKVVLMTPREGVDEDGFRLVYEDCRTELSLDPIFSDNSGNIRGWQYVVRKWVEAENDKKQKEWVIDEEYIPRDGTGKVWAEIPFIFVGSTTNTPSIDNPPMEDIVDVNISHYNNSALYEDSVFMLGQAQPYMTGITEEHLKLLEDQGMYVGSGFLMGVPSGESFGFAQVQPNSLAKEAMDSKIELSVGMGGMFIQPGSAVKTATQSEGEQRTQHSVLSLIVSNTTEAYYKVLEWMARFMKATWTDSNGYTISQEFTIIGATTADLKEVVQAHILGQLPTSDYYNWMKRNNFTAIETEDEFISQLDNAGRSDGLSLQDDPVLDQRPTDGQQQ